tara:strand:- start:1665 stop:2060 length:396 start_codon:yes stop_codon:yes gene_type:complete
MKSFRTFVKESHHSGGITSDVPPDFHRLDQEDVKTRVNAWLEGCSNQEFMSVEAALTQLAGKVQQLGLTFETKPEISGSEGSLTLPVSQFGEKLDPAETHVLVPTIPEDLSMSVDYMTSGQGSFKINAKLN